MPVLPSVIALAAVQRVSPEKGLGSELPSPNSQATRLQNQIFLRFVWFFCFGFWCGVFFCFFFSPLCSGFRKFNILTGEREIFKMKGEVCPYLEDSTEEGWPCRSCGYLTACLQAENEAKHRFPIS